MLADLRLALRTLRRSPGYTATAVLTLAVAVGAAVTVAAVVDRTLLRPLPYRDGDALVWVLERTAAGDERLPSYPTFLDWASHRVDGIAGMAFVRGNAGMLKREQGPERVTFGDVSPGYFTVLGARPLLGRTFTAEEERTNAGSPVVLSHELWRQRFGGDPAIVGRALRVDDALLTVIGVLPAGARYPAWAEAWRPLAAVAVTDAGLMQRGVHSDSRAIARLHPGVSRAAAIAQLSAVAARVAAEHPAEQAGWTATSLTPLRDAVVGEVGPTLLALAGAVVLGLLVACVNVANLSLVRAAGRGREVAVRAALGASRTRIVVGLVAEGVVIALTAGTLGVLLAVWATTALRAAAPPELPRVAELTIDARVLGIALLLSLVAAAVSGLAPAVWASRVGLAAVLRDGRSGSGGVRGRRLRSTLTVAQLALALVLLAGAGLLLRSFRNVQRVEVGFVSERVLVLGVLPPSPRYDEPEAAAGLYERLLAAVAVVPGVEAAALTNHAPALGGGIPTRVLVPGRPEDPAGEDVALYKTASADYLRVAGIPLRRGRWFGPADMTAAATGVVVSESVASRYWPGRDPIGRPITLFKSSQARADFGTAFDAQVIGVVGDVRHFGPEEDPTPEVYVPHTAETWPHAVLLVRVAAGGSSVPALRRAVLAVDPELPLAGAGPLAAFAPLDAALAGSLAQRRWSTGLTAGFAACALLLAALGVYGVTAHAVAQRTREMGVRIALGARRGDIMRLVVRQGAGLAATGTGLGILGALALARVIAGLLFHTSPTDPATLAATAALLLAVSLIASWVPARRAARVDPVVALRD